MDSDSGPTQHPREPKPGFRLPVLGEVTEVWTRQSTADDGPDALSNHEANVKLQSDREHPRRFPVHQDFAGTAAIPKKGDFVRIEYLQGLTERPVITGFAYNEDENRPPIGKPGHFRRKFNDLWIEAERVDHDEIEPGTTDYNVIRLAEKADGLSDPIARIEIDNSGSDPVLRLTRGEEEQDNTDMGLELDFGSGEFKLGDGSGFGIVSDGNGNFTWFENDVNFVDDGTTITW